MRRLCIRSVWLIGSDRLHGIFACSRMRHLRNDFRRERQADATSGIIDSALRERQFAPAIARLGIHAAKCKRPLVGIQF